MEETTKQDTKKIFITGFGLFGSHKVNPSWLAVQELKKIWSQSEADLIIKEIPVCYEYIQKEIPQLWFELKPDLVFHVGVSPLEPATIHLETCAHSNGYVRLDVNNMCGPVAECSTECLTTSLEVEKIVEECKKSFPSIKPSTDAGRFLCEYVFYTSLSMKRAPVLFIHVPLLDDDKVTVEMMATALKSIVESALKQTT